MKKAAPSRDEKSNPVLIVDKSGKFGSKIAEDLSKELLVVYVGQNFEEENSNLIKVSYKKKYPSIPDNTYSIIILVDEEDLGLEESLPTFVKKAMADESRVVYVSGLSEKSQQLAKKLTQSYKEVKSILYADLISDSLSDFDNPAEEAARSALADKNVKLSGDGLEMVRPVYIKDAFEKVYETIFGKDEGQVFFLFQKHPISLISFAHLLQKIDPDVTIDFKKGRVKDEEKIILDGEFLINEDYRIEDRLKNLDYKTSSDEKKITKTHTGNNTKKRNFNIFYPLLLFVFVFLLPLLSTSFFALLGAVQIKIAQNYYAGNKVGSLADSITLGNYFFKNAIYSSKILGYQADLIGQRFLFSNIVSKIENYQKLLDAIEKGSEGGKTLESILSGETQNPANDTLFLSSTLKNSFNLIQEVKASEQDKKIEENLKEWNTAINAASSLNNVLYSFLNPNGKKSYLVLFQNNMELRPGGGFIGSYGVLSLDKGKISDFTINDVYDADGQLRGHIEPPYPIRRYLPDAHWYLRNSNFDVDFTKSASSAAFFLYAETGQRVDGVIGADVTFVKEIISALGEIYVPDYKEKINEHNFYKVTQTHVEKNFFPSSTQKKDFLAAVFSALKLRLDEKKNLPYGALLKNVSDSIEEKHLVFAFIDKNVQNVFTANGWSSVLKDGREKETVNDFLGISEANLGVNKANFFLGRSVKYEASLDKDGDLLSKATVSFKNISGEWPGGDYKAYLRIITPQGSNLTGVKIDNFSQRITDPVTDPTLYESKSFRPPEGLEVEKYNQDGKNIYGFLVIIPKSKSKIVEVEYSLPEKISPSNSTSTYSLRIFKQPGTLNYPFDFSFSSQSPLKISSPSHEIIEKEKKIMLSRNLEKDEDIVLNILK
jgi:hypothetical protein